VLRARGDVRGDVDLRQLELQRPRGFRDVALTIGATLRNHRFDLLVLARVQRLERQVLELPFERVNAEAVGERRVDLERLLRLLDLLLLAEVLDLAQVVQPVRKLDQDHTRVLGHRHDQLAVVLRLRLLPALELDAGQLRDALDQLRDLVSELAADVIELDVGVLDDVVQQRRRNCLIVEVELCTDLGGAPRVQDEVLSRPALLALMRAGGEEEGAPDQVAVDVRVVCRDVRNQLVDELLVLFMSLKDSHTPSVLRGILAPSPVPGLYLKGRKRRSDGESDSFMRWYRRRQERKAALRAARLIVALDALCSTRPEPRRVRRASLGPAR
jgi:hypothetical protein